MGIPASYGLTVRVGADSEHTTDYPSRMSIPSYLSIVERLASFDPHAYVFGGIAEDALLDGSMTRPHGDVDVLVGRASLDQHLAQLGSLEFGAFEVYYEPQAGRPLGLGCTHGDVSIELGLYDELEPGIASFVLPGEVGFVRIALPGDTLRHPIGSIDGVPIRTVSPLALYHLRETFIRTRVFGPPRDKDVGAQARLRSELLAGTPAGDLDPDITAA